MNTDQIKGKVQNAFGKVEESVGKAVNSPNLTNAGTEDRLKGSAKETWGNAKDTVNEVRNTAHTSAAVHADHVNREGMSVRDRIVDGVERVKENINAKMDDVKEREQIKREEMRRTA